MSTNAPTSPRPPRTPGNQLRTFLIYGFAISIVLHLLIGPLIKFNHSQPEEEQPAKVSIDVMPTPPPTPRPTPKPTPTPPPTPPPKQTPPPQKSTPQPHVQRIKINTLKTVARNNQQTELPNTHNTGSDKGNPAGDTNAPTTSTAAPVASPAPPTPVPTPTPTKPPSCANPNVAPTTVNAVAPDTPPIAAQQGITGVVQVLVTLDEQSHIVETKVQSSPSSLLNNAAVQAAKQSTFRTEVKDCKPVAATYIYSVEFNNQ